MLTEHISQLMFCAIVNWTLFPPPPPIFTSWKYFLCVSELFSLKLFVTSLCKRFLLFLPFPSCRWKVSLFTWFAQLWSCSTPTHSRVIQVNVPPPPPVLPWVILYIFVSSLLEIYVFFPFARDTNRLASFFRSQQPFSVNSSTRTDVTALIGGSL